MFTWSDDTGVVVFMAYRRSSKEQQISRMHGQRCHEYEELYSVDMRLYKIPLEVYTYLYHNLRCWYCSLSKTSG